MHFLFFIGRNYFGYVGTPILCSLWRLQLFWHRNAWGFVSPNRWENPRYSRHVGEFLEFMSNVPFWYWIFLAHWHAGDFCWEILLITWTSLFADRLAKGNRKKKHSVGWSPVGCPVVWDKLLIHTEHPRKWWALEDILLRFKHGVVLGSKLFDYQGGCRFFSILTHKDSRFFKVISQLCNEFHGRPWVRDDFYLLRSFGRKSWLIKTLGCLLYGLSNYPVKCHDSRIPKETYQLNLIL